MCSSDLLGDFGPTLRWSNPPDATQVQLQVIPAKNDGPGVDVYLGSPATSFTLPAPPDWYGLLPGMTYSWRVRASNSTTFATSADPSWSEWTTGTFRSPSTSFRDALAWLPGGAETVTTLTPTLQWTAPSWIYYFELQLSKDPTFNTNPATATAMVYQALLHGGVTNPPNSYAVPRSFPLEPGTRY